MFKLSLETYGKDVIKEMRKAERRQRTKAARYMHKKLKQEAQSRFGAESDITKGVVYRHDKEASLVGMGPPAYAAHLIEFGTDSRYTKSGKPTGYIRADPFVFPTFDREAAATIQILSEAWF